MTYLSQSIDSSTNPLLKKECKFQVVYQHTFSLIWIFNRYWMLRIWKMTTRWWFSTLNKQSFEALSSMLQHQPKLEVLRPHFNAENTTALYHLVVRSKLNPQDRQQAFMELDRLARLETELELNVAANIKKKLSVGFLQVKDFARAKQYGQDALKVLRMMAEPHPVEIATFLQQLGEVYYATERRSDKGHKLLNQAIQLFEEALKLEPDNKTVLMNLAYSYTRVCWHFVFSGELLKARQFCGKAEELWEKLPEKGFKTYVFFVQAKCLLLFKLGQREQAGAAAREVLKGELALPNRCWFLSLLSKIGDKDSQGQLTAALAELEKKLPPEHFKNYKQMLGAMLTERSSSGTV